MRALVVDDSSAMRAFLRMTLTGAGIEVEEARNGKEGLRALETALPDLVLLDWNMPEMNGFDMLQQIRADARYRGIKVMMVTTETEMAELARALAAGADEYVMKPFTREMILEKLELLGVLPQAI
jgi:two-component system chemotaxis response regulator CheY